MPSPERFYHDIERQQPEATNGSSYEQLIARLEQAIGEIHNSDAFRQYLNIQARFPHYSPSNVGMILTQRREATRVMGYGNKEGTTGWKSLGRQVKRGEKGIRIFAPQFRKITDVTTGEEERRLTGFRLVSVWDISQTDGRALPELHVPVLEGDEGGELYSRLDRFALRENLQVEPMPAAEQARSSSLMGYFEPRARLIRVRSDVAQLQRTKTLAHELGHYVAGHGERCSSDDRREQETEAESIAYVTCAHFGLDIEQRSFPYIATWSQDRDTLKRVLGRIQTSAARIIDGIEGGAAHPSESAIDVEEPTEAAQPPISPAHGTPPL